MIASYNKGEEFRTAFKKLRGLKSFFPNVPVIGLSGTLTVSQKETIPKQLGLEDFHTIEKTPDRPNIFLKKIKERTRKDVMNEYEQIVHKLCDDLYDKKADFPVTLLFLPVYYMSEAMVYLLSLFGTSTINDSIYSAICSGQDQYVIDATIISIIDKVNSVILRVADIVGISSFSKCWTRLAYVDLKKMGKENGTGKADVLTDADIDALFSSGQLGLSNPTALLHTVWFCNTVYFGLRGVTEHYQMRWGDVKLCKDHKNEN
ncbi:unnamed protein product [Mytilus edulis]|uniref:ZMYM2-like/QRICH1 C-terminal domain-containing protein n=1 Tax=Mytilus edulis TaxID=6550 RepID=A0A8S3THK2_MYTED|nr:unnamed protein product [Mytilus edulis]